MKIFPIPTHKPTSQYSPVNPGLHLHWNLVPFLRHVAPFVQGSLKQGSSSISSQKLPKRFFYYRSYAWRQWFSLYPATLVGICIGKSAPSATTGRKPRWSCTASVARMDASRKWSSIGTDRSSKIHVRTFSDPWESAWTIQGRRSKVLGRFSRCCSLHRVLRVQS